MKKRRLYKSTRSTAELYMRNECEKLNSKYKLDEQILTEAQEYFTKSVQRKLYIGRSLDEIFYVSLYLSYRMLRIPKLPSDITKISHINRNRLQKVFRLFVGEFNLTVPPLDPGQLIISRSGNLDICKETIREAVSLVKKARETRILSGKAPSSIAAVATFVASQRQGKDLKQEQIAETFGVSTTTIRNLSRKLEEL